MHSAAPAAESLARVERHADALLAVARRYSACPADARAAYRRSLEIFRRRPARLEAPGADRWLYLVVKQEALALRSLRASSRAACPSPTG